MGRAFDKGWLNETYFILMFITSIIFLLGIIFVGIGVCMSLGNLRMKTVGNRSLFGGVLTMLAGMAGMFGLYQLIINTMNAEKITVYFPVGMPLYMILTMLMVILGVYIFVATPKADKSEKMEMETKYKLFLMLMPFLALVFAFSYLPLFSWRYAFFDYEAGGELSKDNFVGFKWFLSLVQNPTYVKRIVRVLRNTLVMSGLGIATSWVPMFFAIFLMEVKSVRFRKLVQLFTTVPNFISWVMVYAIAFAIFQTDGFINTFVNQIFDTFNVAEVLCAIVNNFSDIVNTEGAIGFINKVFGTKWDTNYLMPTDFMWVKMLLWGIWKSLGWSAIIYISSIAGIDQQLYEAATVDGAGRFQKIRYITLPGLLPTYVVMLVMSIAGILSNGMDQYLVFATPNNKKFIEVLDLYVYNLGIGSGDIPLSTVVGMTKSIVSVALLFVANKVSKAIRGENVV
ncbi:MAG: sugar ABC transporter permease [Lachnospiraceae bacterium]|nr:sugar ABC transporter permease [Lachnospiraceae bacterium]